MGIISPCWSKQTLQFLSERQPRSSWDCRESCPSRELPPTLPALGQLLNFASSSPIPKDSSHCQAAALCTDTGCSLQQPELSLSKRLLQLCLGLLKPPPLPAAGSQHCSIIQTPHRSQLHCRSTHTPQPDRKWQAHHNPSSKIHANKALSSSSPSPYSKFYCKFIHFYSPLLKSFLVKWLSK